MQALKKSHKKTYRFVEISENVYFLLFFVIQDLFDGKRYTPYGRIIHFAKPSKF